VAVWINSEKIARDVIVVGASAGGFVAVIDLLSQLPADLAAFIGVVIHRGAASSSNWSASLGRKTQLTVVEPAHGDALKRGVVYVAPGDCHMTFESDRIALDGAPKEHHTRPAVDPLFSSAARAYGRRVVGIVLSGGGHDGMLGLRDVTTAGGLSLAQKLSEAEHNSMPAFAIAHDHVCAALTVEELGAALLLLVAGKPVQVSNAEVPATPASPPAERRAGLER
jgi:two-component system chemotaxis response regulator CheB